MKKQFTFLMGIAVVCALLMAVPEAAEGQTLYDYAGVSDSPVQTNPLSVIRRESSGRAVFSYVMNGKTYIGLVDLYGNIKRADIGPDKRVYDMRVVGDELYFCGSVSGVQAFVGHLKIHQLATSPGPFPIDFTYLKASETDCLTRMVAYRWGTEVKVVAIGYNDCLWYNCSYVCPTNATCRKEFVFECVFTSGLPSTSSPIRLQVVNPGAYGDRMEVLDDIVETDNYVAIVGVYDNAWFVIRRCRKDDIMLTMSNLFLYPFQGRELLMEHKACRMRGDTIAVASQASDIDLNPENRTRFRVFDMATMNMLVDQEFEHGIKVKPDEMVYVPVDKTVVLLQEMPIPSLTNNNSVFVQLHPYQATPYVAQGWYTTSGLRYGSLDVRDDENYIATGGNYWITKHLPNCVSSTGCYTPCLIRISGREPVTYTADTFVYPPTPCFDMVLSPVFGVETRTPNVLCAETDNK